MNGLRREHADDCRRLLNQWFEEKGNGDPYMKAEKDAILEALAQFEDLGLLGGGRHGRRPGRGLHFRHAPDR